MQKKHIIACIALFLLAGLCAGLVSRWLLPPRPPEPVRVVVEVPVYPETSDEDFKRTLLEVEQFGAIVENARRVAVDADYVDLPGEVLEPVRKNPAEMLDDMASEAQAEVQSIEAEISEQEGELEALGRSLGDML